jgi:hypothetical protein
VTTRAQRNTQSAELLQEGVSCAHAVLHAISAGSMLGALPEDSYARTAHNHATQLLAMLEDNLRAIQTKVDALDADDTEA